MSPRGDAVPIKSNYYRGGHYGSSSGSSYYDDEGRGASKDLWEWFERNYTANPTPADRKVWLLNLSNDKCYQLWKGSVTRFNLMDITYHWSPGWKDGYDTRAHRLVLKDLYEDDWVDFYNHLHDAWAEENARREKAAHDAAEKSNADWKAYMLAREAEAAKVLREDIDYQKSVSDLTIGQLSTELGQVFVYNDKEGQEGDYIEDVVEAFVGNTGGGFGYEERKAVGVKIQITVSLDLSNSMMYNAVHYQAANSFRDLCHSLKMLKAMYADDLFIQFFTFCEDSWEGYGKRAESLKYSSDVDPSDTDDKKFFGALERFKPSIVKTWEHTYGEFQGHDSWLSPLFTEIESWERENSDPGAMKLDLIITDGVFEHAKDIRESDAIQERRNGVLNTVLLNFLKESEWLQSTLPKRTYQMHVDVDNIDGILRQVIAEFVGAYV